MKNVVLLMSVVAIIVLAFYWVKPQMHSAEGKIRVVMTGRSTMKLWFKHWNWPYPLRIKTTYKNWPIKFDKYSSGDVYFEYQALPGPVSEDKNKVFGKDMLDKFEHILVNNKYDVAFFKFCFVDFRIEANNHGTRLEQLQDTVKGASAIAGEYNIQLIIGNALPMPNSNKATVDLQIDFNKWLYDYANEKNNVIAFDLFSPLVERNGKLKVELSRGDGDPHLGDNAFSLLDKKLIQAVSAIKFQNERI